MHYAFLVRHWLQSPLEKMQKSASFQKAMLNKKPAEPPSEVGSVEDVGREELSGFDEPLRTRLKVCDASNGFMQRPEKVSPSAKISVPARLPTGRLPAGAVLVFCLRDQLLGTEQRKVCFQISGGQLWASHISRLEGAQSSLRIVAGRCKSRAMWLLVWQRHWFACGWLLCRQSLQKGLHWGKPLHPHDAECPLSSCGHSFEVHVLGRTGHLEPTARDPALHDRWAILHYDIPGQATYCTKYRRLGLDHLAKVMVIIIR